MARALKNSTLDVDCSVALPWDFPYGGLGQGNTGRCLVHNMGTGKGCAVKWARYLYDELWLVGSVWLFLAFLQVCLFVVPSNEFSKFSTNPS